MRYTTNATNGYPSPPSPAGAPAIAIMPRWSTAIAFDASTGAEALAAHNAAAGADVAQRAPSLEALLAREAERVLAEGFLPLRADGYMFHQANMRVAGSGITAAAASGSGSGSSLLMAWADAALARLSALVDWPVISLKLDDLKAAFLEREARDACRLRYRLSVSRGAGAVTAVTVVSSAPAAAGGGAVCAAPLMLRGGVALEALPPPPAPAPAPAAAASARGSARGLGAAEDAAADAADATAAAAAAAAAAAVTVAPDQSGGGARTLLVSLPPGGAVTLRVSAGALPWPFGAAGGAARSRQRQRQA